MNNKSPRSKSALRALAKSRIKNALSADPSLPPERRHLYRLESEALLSAGKKDLELDEQPGIGAGGEIPADLGDELGPFFRDTVKSPHLVTAKASRDRLELASDAGCLDLAIDAAETAGAKIVVQNSQASLSTSQTQSKRDDLAVQIHNPLRVGQTQPQHLVALDIRIGHKLRVG